MREIRVVKIADIFQDRMMLQRDKSIPIWGTAEPGAEISVTVCGSTWTGIADAAGNWRVTFGPLPAGTGLELMAVSGGERIVFTDVAVGEVFVAGGQSNMEFLMRYEKHFAEERQQCNNDAVRFYDVPEVAYPGQDKDFDYSRVGVWRKATTKDLDYFSAPGYYFAKRLHAELGVPVGIIGLNWGGTRSSSWMTEEHARTICPEQTAEFEARLGGQSYEDFIREAGHNPLNDRGYSVWDPFSEFIMPNTPGQEEVGAFFGQMMAAGVDITRFVELPDPKFYPGALYTHMVCRVAPYGVKGVLWYQGESDDEVDGSAVHYAASLSALIADWRTDWQEELPFFIVQLPGFRSWLACVDKNYPLIRQAQQQVCDEDENAFLCSISDLGEELDIHPKNKRDVGDRLALLALRHLYGKALEADAPVCREAVREGNTIILHFDHAGSGLTLRGDRIEALSVRAADTEYPFSCSISGGELILRLEQPCGAPLEIAFAQGDWYCVNLYNSAGIPAIPFRLSC